MKARRDGSTRVDLHEVEARWPRVGNLAKELDDRVRMHAGMYVQDKSSAKWDQKSPLAWKSRFLAGYLPYPRDGSPLTKDLDQNRTFNLKRFFINLKSRSCQILKSHQAAK
ncbi:hypothetical protein ACLB2K_048326 [Fragaria x ananassa]